MSDSSFSHIGLLHDERMSTDPIPVVVLQQYTHLQDVNRLMSVRRRLAKRRSSRTRAHRRASAVGNGHTNEKSAGSPCVARCTAVIVGKGFVMVLTVACCPAVRECWTLACSIAALAAGQWRGGGGDLCHLQRVFSVIYTVDIGV